MNQPINWEYFFGGHGNEGRTFRRYYKAKINNKSVERCSSNRGTEYSIGNIDKAKIKFKTEEALIKACYD